MSDIFEITTKGNLNELQQLLGNNLKHINDVNRVRRLIL